MAEFSETVNEANNPLFPELHRLREENDRLTSVVSEMRRSRDRQRKRVEDLTRRYDLAVSLDQAVVGDAPELWLKRAVAGDTKFHGVACTISSDLHLDEVVIPAQVEYANAYNRPIALDRLKRHSEKFFSIARDHLGYITYDGAAIFSLGDVFSGNIHEELKETNEAPIMASFDYWLDPYINFVKSTAEEFGKVVFIGRTGNHGRNTRKPIFKNRVEDNFDWLFYRVIHRELKSDPRIEWDLPLSAGGTVSIYDTKFHATHGDNINGGNGISGIYHPVALADFRARKAYAQMDMQLDDGRSRVYDWLVLGHWHNYLTLNGVIVNGSSKGYDEYAIGRKFGFETPTQAFWVTTPEHGPAFHVGIEVMKRESEGW